MSGLTAGQLGPETLHAGDTIEYYCRAFVAGDRKGHRFAKVTRIDDGKDVELPIVVDTGDIIPGDMMMKRVADRFGAPYNVEGKPPASKWRKLRTYELAAGSFAAPSRSSTLQIALEGAVAAACETVREALRSEHEEYVPESPDSSESSSSEPMPDFDEFQPSSASSPHLATTTTSAVPSTAPKETIECGGIQQRSSLSQIINLVSSDEESGAEPATPRSVSDQTLAEATAYVRKIPNRHKRAKIRHQAKKRNGQWHVPRSRKKRDLAKCAITKSGTSIYHAKTVKAIRFKNLLKLPEVKLRLANLHCRRTTYPDPASREERVLFKRSPVAKAEIESIVTCKPNGVKFRGIGAFDACQCAGDCFLDTCANVACASFCTPECCSLGARCNNAPVTLKTLKLFETGRVGLGVYTTTDLDIRDILGEYCGELSEFPALVKGQPAQAVKQNSGYTLLYNAKSTKKNYVYVDALKRGSITRFISHSCDPNAAFVEQQTGTIVKVLVKMIKDVKAGAQVTVHYGNERCFTCACDECWEPPEEECSDEY